MRVIVTLGLAVLVAVVVRAPAVAAPADRVVAEPEVRCALTDRRLAETSGLAWSLDGLLVVNDSGNPSTVYRLDDRCAVVGTRAVPVPGRDVEDLARTADGTLWLADTGDNGHARTSVAVIRLPPGGGEQVIRLTYPDGPHDAETLLMPADRRPVLVTKDVSGRSGIYDTAAPLPAGSGPVPLWRAGTATVPPSDTPGGPTPFGAGLYTGGALSADGRVAALRTYTDAWLYPVAAPGSADAVVAALGAVPVKIPLANEPQGEAIAFGVDGTLLSAGESPGTRATVRSVPGATALVSDTHYGLPIPTAGAGPRSPSRARWPRPRRSARRPGSAAAARCGRPGACRS